MELQYRKSVWVMHTYVDVINNDESNMADKSWTLDIVRVEK